MYGLRLPDRRSVPTVQQELDRLVDRLRHAMPEEFADISNDARRLEILVNIAKAGRKAQQQAARVHIYADWQIGEILDETERQRVGRPRKNDSHGIILPRLRDFGLSPAHAYRCRRLHKIPRWLLDREVQVAIDTGRELTLRWIFNKCESYLQRQHNLEPQVGGQVEDLHDLIRAGRRFGTVYIDLPWPIPGCRLPYPTMTPDEMAALPINQLADPVKCYLHMWALGGRCQEIAYRLARLWGFRVVSDFIWIKEGPFGNGNLWRGQHEPLLTCLREHDDGGGFADHGLRSCRVFPRGRHSEKPDEVRKMIERVSPPPRLELFARSEVEGWVTWGHGIERPPMEQDIEKLKRPRYWKTPEEKLAEIKNEKVPKGRRLVDVCPDPLPEGFNALDLDWSTLGLRRGDYVLLNMPFRPSDIENVGDEKVGPTAFVRKAISECKRLGCGLIAFYPTPLSVNLLLEAGAKAESLDRLAFEEVETGEPDPSPRPVTMFVLPAPE